MSETATTIRDPALIRIINDAKGAMSMASDHKTELAIIVSAAGSIERHGDDDGDAIGALSDFAIQVRGHAPDTVQAAIVRGIGVVLDEAAAKVVRLRPGQATREPPRPLMREMPPADPFPIAALGPLTAAAQAIHERTQAPLATCGQSVLAAATLAIQGLADVELPTRQVRPVSLFFVTVAGTGERKTSVDNEALRPVRRQEADLRDEYAESMPSYQNDVLAWEKAREASIKKAGKDRAAIKAALDAIGEKPTPPWLPVLAVTEPTYEGLCKLFATSRPSLGVFSSEGGQFMGGHGMAEDAKLRTAAGLSCLWDGDAIKRVRADGTTILPDRRLAVHLMAQPDVAAGWLNDPLLADQGLLSRVLVSAPDSTAGTRFWREWSGSGALADYDHALFTLLRQPLPIDQAGGGVKPRALVMSPAVRRAWIDLHDWVEVRVRPGGEYDAIRGLANKLPEHAARLAAVLTVAADSDAGEIEAEAMNCGAELAQHYASEALRLFQGGTDDPGLRLAKKTLAWLRAQGRDVFHLREIYQFGPSAIRDKATATKIIGMLTDHGYLEQVQGGAEVSGKWHKNVWRLFPEE